MTVREQLEAKYGKASTSPPMTVRQQLEAKYGKATVNQPVKDSFTNSVYNSAVQRGSDIVNTINQGGQGQLNPGEAGLRTVGAGAGFIGDVIGAGINSLTPQPVKDFGLSLLRTPLGQAGLEAAKAGVEAYQNWKAKNLNIAKDLESVVNIATLFPVGKGVQVGGKAGIEATGKGLAVTGGLTETGGSKLMGAILTPTESQANKVINYRAKTPLPERIIQSAGLAESKAPVTVPDVALKYNLARLTRGQVGTAAKKTANELWENIVNPAIDNIKDKIDKDAIFNAITKKINQTADLSKKNALLDALNSLKDDYKGVKTFSLKQLDSIKSEMASSLPAKVWKGQDITGTFNNIRKMFSEEARNVVRSKLPKEVKSIYDDYGSLKELATKGAKSLTEGFNSGVLGLLSKEIKTLALPVTAIPGNVIGKTGTAIKKAGQSLLKK